MEGGYYGEIRMFGGNFAPRNWALCGGQLIPISQNQALFSLLGTTYGGDGRTTFGLPDLRGRIPVGTGDGPGLTSRPAGQKGGEEKVTLTVDQIPSHTHSVHIITSAATATAVMKVNSGSSDQQSPANHYLGVDQGAPFYASSHSGDTLSLGAVEVTINSDYKGTSSHAGLSESHLNLQPYVVTNYIICTSGIFPSRN